MPRSTWSRAAGAALAVSLLAAPAATARDRGPQPLVARDAEVVVLTGADVPAWSRAAATGVPAAHPSGFPKPVGDGVRSAHHGTLVVPPDARAGVDVNRVAAYRWTAKGWRQVPVQIDERYPYFLANARSSFAPYSGVDEELTYAWDVEAWKKVAGECSSRYPESLAEAQALASAGVITPGLGETLQDYLGAKPDPVPGLDDDDEIVFMASDAGARAPLRQAGPKHSLAGTRQEVALADPAGGAVTYVYLFETKDGSEFDADNGYVRYERAADADEWLDRYSFRRDDPEKLGTSNTGYGPNLRGTVCRTAVDEGYPAVADGVARASTDRFPRDGVTVRTAAYQWTATGRWMVRGMQVAKPENPGAYGPDLIDRWKGRAFQQSPDSFISLVGFEDEQVNWEANAALLGERRGPVRAIREVWGADSGTNVTKTEYFYRDAVAYRYHVRVHPIPPDGLYTSWDYNTGVAERYYNALRPDGVAIDGVNDDIGNIDKTPDGRPAFFDAPDPTFDVPSAFMRWEQVSGKGDAGSLVYIFENKGLTSFTNPAVVPYYRDDKCLDDGTGDAPVPRPWPGEASSDQRVKDGYAALAGKPYNELTCDERQGAWGSHGLHFLATHDTDNTGVGKPVNEVDGQQWQFAVPTSEPTNVGERYGNVVRVPLRPVVLTQQNTPEPRHGPRS